MSTQPKTFLSPAEYLELERRAEFKSEYYEGEMFAMAGASPRHVWITANLVARARAAVEGKTVPRIGQRSEIAGHSHRPIHLSRRVVVCGEPRFADDQKDTLLNPTVIIEVLSESTRDYDRGRKFQHYRTLPSLAEYLTVEQDEPHVEHCTRQPESRWLLAEFADLGQSIRLASIDCVLPLAEIYDKIDWSAEAK